MKTLYRKAPPIFFLLLSLSFQIKAQSPHCDCNLKGIIRDTATHQPIVGVAVYLKGTKYGTFTDASGAYALNNICHGKYQLVCQLVGYQVVERTVDLLDEHHEDFTLHETDDHLQEVIVLGQKQTVQTQVKNTLDGEALEQSRGQSLGEALKAVSGVTSLQTGSSISKPVIHGMHSNRVLIMNNGIRQEGQQWGAEHAPEIDPFIAKKISVVKGAAGVRYGSDAIGGVILVEPEALPDSSAFHGEVNLVGFSNGRQGVLSSILQGGFNKIKGLVWRVQGTIKKGGDTKTAEYFLQNTGSEEQNFSLTAAYRKSNWGTEVFFSQFNSLIGIFTGSHIGNVDDLKLALSRPRPLEIYTPDSPSYEIGRPYQDVQHNLLKIKSFANLNKLGKLSLTLGRQFDYRSERDVLRGTKDFIQTFLMTTYSSELLLEHRPLLPHISGMIGLSNVYQENLSSGTTISEPNSRTVLIPNFQNLTTGIFLIEDYQKGNWEIEGGVRFDFRNLSTFQKAPAPASDILESNFSDNNFSGTIGAVYTFSESFKARINLASAWRPAQVNELFSNGVHHGAAAYELGDRNLTPETAKNLSFTLNYESAKFSAEATLYSNTIGGYIYLQPQDSLIYTIRGAFPFYKYRQTDALFQGIDLSTNLLITKQLSLISKFSIVRATDTKRNIFLYGIPSDRLENTLKYQFAQRKLSLALTHSWVAQQTRFEPLIDFLPPPAAYNLWGFQGNFSFSQKLNFGVSITNLFNVSYREYMNRFRYFTDDMGRNISVRVKYTF